MAFEFTLTPALPRCPSNKINTSLRSKEKPSRQKLTHRFHLWFVLACSITHYGKCPCVGELSPARVTLRECMENVTPSCRLYTLLAPQALPLLCSLFRACEFYTRKIKGDESAIVRGIGTPPIRGHLAKVHSLLCAFYCSRAAFWTMLTSLTDNKDYLGKSFKKFLG